MAVTTATTLTPVSRDAAAQGREPVPAPAPHTRITVTVNGERRQLDVEDRWTLVELLRDHFDLTGTKVGCDRGECGACTVHLDGLPVYACSQLAVWADGREVTTVEGLGDDQRLDPLQQAFIDGDGPQCGFCTAGQLMSAKALVTANPTPTEDEVRAGMAGNICRCSNYNRYVAAVLSRPPTPATRPGFKRFSDSPCTAWARRGTSACTNAGGPMQAYSMDLRERALLDSDAGMKAADVAVKYRVSGSWVRLLKQRRRETGEVAPRVQRHGRRRMLEPHLHTLAALIAEQPDRTLAELKDALGTPASLATIWRAVAALDVTVKKNGPALRTRST